MMLVQSEDDPLAQRWSCLCGEGSWAWRAEDADELVAWAVRHRDTYDLHVNSVGPIPNN